MNVYLVTLSYDYSCSDVRSIHETLEGATQAAHKIIAEDHFSQYKYEYRGEDLPRWRTCSSSLFVSEMRVEN